MKDGTGLVYQAVGRRFGPHKAEDQGKPAQEAMLGYDRTRLSTKDVPRTGATARYAGKGPTCTMTVGLPVPPGFTAGAGGFAEPVGPGACRSSA